MMKITLDTSCMDDSVKDLRDNLVSMQNKKQIQLYMDQEPFEEKQNWCSEQLKTHLKKLEQLSWMLSNVNSDDMYAKEIPEGCSLEDVLTNNIEEIGKIYKKVRNIHSPEFRDDKIKHFRDLSDKKQINKYNDWMILSKHIIKKRDFFVTLNTTDFIYDGKNDRRKIFQDEFKEYGLKIRELNKDFLKELGGIIK